MRTRNLLATLSLSVLFTGSSFAGNNHNGCQGNCNQGGGDPNAEAVATAGAIAGAVSGTNNSGNSDNQNYNANRVDDSGNSSNYNANRVDDSGNSHSSSAAGVLGSGNSSSNNEVDVTDGDVAQTTDVQNNSSTTVTDNSTTVVNVGGEDGAPLTASSQTVGDTSQSQTVEGDTDNSVVAVDARNQSVTNYEAAAIPVNTAATTFSSICTSGAASQSTTYGISLSVTSDVCTHLMMADAWIALGDTERALKHVKAASRHAKVKGWFGYFRHVVTFGIL